MSLSRLRSGISRRWGSDNFHDPRLAEHDLDIPPNFDLEAPPGSGLEDLVRGALDIDLDNPDDVFSGLWKQAGTIGMPRFGEASGCEEESLQFRALENGFLAMRIEDKPLSEGEQVRTFRPEIDRQRGRLCMFEGRLRHVVFFFKELDTLAKVSFVADKAMARVYCKAEEG